MTPRETEDKCRRRRLHPARRCGVSFSLAPLAASLLFLLSGGARADLYFDPGLISSASQGVADLTHFEHAGAQPPGAYPVDVYLNGSQVATWTVRFVPATPDAREHPAAYDDTGLMPCLSKKNLLDLGVNFAAVPGLDAVAQDACLSPSHVIPQATSVLDFQKMRLNITVPQAAMKNTPRDWIPPEQWDDGINAALLNYQFSGSDNRGRYGNSRSDYLNLTSGLNLGAWRLRDNSTWSDSESAQRSQRRFTHLNTYAERAIIPWRSELTMGDSMTGSDVFDSLSFRGVQMGTDDSMFPDTQRGFAPQIKGAAHSNARVSIRQNGNVIYQIFVPPGAFVINDLNPLSSGGDLDVTVTEADGSTHAFVVPYSSVPVLQRAGHVKYEVTAGRYRSSSDRYATPAFAQGALMWGLPFGLTAYGGAQMADRYQAVALGAGTNMGDWGALSADVTQANSQLADNSRHQGQSMRFLYARSLVSTGTTFELAGYRYSTQGFHTLEETALKGMSGWLYDTQGVDVEGRPVKRPYTDYYNLYDSKRERVQANVSQSFGSLGSLYLNATRQTYWNNSRTSRSLQAGYSISLGNVSYNLSYSDNRDSGQSSADRVVDLSLSVPLDVWLSHGDAGEHHHSMWATFSANRDSEGNVIQQSGLSGSALEEDNLNWSLAQGYGRREGESGSASLDYQGTYGKSNLGYSYSDNYRQVSYGAAGGAVLHRGGLTLGQPLGVTNILVAAPGAAGVPVENGQGVRTDWRGYTVVPYASTYRENRVSLDVSQLDDHTDIEDAIARVVPTRDALVRADFKAHTGVRALMTLTHGGKPLPFGATVAYGDGGSIVGDDGQVYLAGLSPQGVVHAQWGSAPDQQCVVHFQLPERAVHVPLVQVNEVCQ